MTFVSAGFFMATLGVIKSAQLAGVALPSWARATALSALGLLLVRHSLILSGRINSGEAPKEVIVPQIVGMPLSKFMPSVAPLHAGVLYVVTQEGCGACAKAERDLNTFQVAWRKVPTCTLAASSGCYAGQGQSFVTPMLLMCDSQGRIAFQHIGWNDGGVDLQRMKTQIQTTQQRLRAPQREH